MALPRHVVRTRAPQGPGGSARCTTDPEVVASFLQDAAHTPGGRAPAVCFPASERQLADFVVGAPALLCVGAQSSLTGGATPCGARVVSTASLASIESVRSDRAVVGPGLVLRDLSAALADRNLWYPPVPTYDGATIGGTVATNAAGAATFAYGTTRDWIEGLTVVLANGEVLELRRGEICADAAGRFEIVMSDGSSVRFKRPDIAPPQVPKLSCGYFSAPDMDLIDLFIGSEGTLGIVTRVEIRVVKKPRQMSWLLTLANEARALALTAALRSASQRSRRDDDPNGIDVTAIEFADAPSIELLVADAAPSRIGVPLQGDAQALLFVQMNLPADADDASILDELARADDPLRDHPVAHLCKMLARHGALATALPALPSEDRKQAAFAALREAVPDAVNRRIGAAQRIHGPSLTKAAADVIVPFPRLGEALAAYRAAAARHELACATWGHVSDGNVHPNLLPDDAVAAARTSAALLEMGRKAIELGGAPMSEHGVGRNPIKQQLLRELYGERGVESMRAIKRTLDPRGALAPGVLFET